MPDGWCAAPIRFEPENELGDPAPLTAETLARFRAMDRLELVLRHPMTLATFVSVN